MRPKAQINYHLIEIGGILVDFLLKFTSNNGFQLFLDVLLNFAHGRINLQLARISFLNNLNFL